MRTFGNDGGGLCVCGKHKFAKMEPLDQCWTFFLVALLDSLTKNKQSADDHSQPKESYNLGSQKRTEDFASANGEAGGDTSKGYTPDQVDAVKR